MKSPSTLKHENKIHPIVINVILCLRFKHILTCLHFTKQQKSYMLIWDPLETVCICGTLSSCCHMCVMALKICVFILSSPYCSDLPNECMPPPLVIMYSCKLFFFNYPLNRLLSGSPRVYLVISLFLDN